MINDDYYYDSFSDYVPTTIDPGPWMLIGVSLYSIFCILFLPICVFVAKKRRKKYQDKLDALIAEVDIDKANDSLIAEIDIDKADDSHVHEEEKGTNTSNENTTVVGLSGEGNIKTNGIIDLSHGRDMEGQEDLTNNEFVTHFFSNLFALPNMGTPSVISTKSEISVISFHSRRKRRKRGKSRILSSDIQSELSIPHQKNKVDENVSRDETVEDDIESTEVRLHVNMISITYYIFYADTTKPLFN